MRKRPRKRGIGARWRGKGIKRVAEEKGGDENNGD